MKLLSLLLALIFATTQIGYAAKVEDDTLTVGKPGSSANKVFKLGDRTIRDNQSTGKLEFSTDGSIYKSIGSGSGGAGAITLLENGGFEDGVTSQWESTVSTVTAITGATVLVGDTSAQFDPAAQNDYLRTTYQTVKPGIRGSACEARFLYSGGDALNYSAKVETESGVTLGVFRNQAGNNVLPVHSLVGYESIFFPCPTEADVLADPDNGNVRLVIYQGTVTDATAMLVDDVHLGGLIGLVETILPDNFGAYISATGVVSSENSNFIDGNCSVTSTNQFSCPMVAGITDSGLVCQVGAVTGGQDRCANLQNTLSGSFSYATFTCSTNGVAAYPVFVTCQRSGSEAKQSVQVYKSIPKIAENENSFSALISSAGVIGAESTDWIDGNCSISDTSLYNCPLKPGLFTLSPICMAGTDTNNLGYAANVTGASTSAITYRTTNAAGTKTAEHAQLICNRRGTDLKATTTQPTILGQVTNSVSEGSSLTNVRTESCQVNNSGTATIDATSGLCESWVSSVNRTSAGIVTVTFIAGRFSVRPLCTVISNDVDKALIGIDTSTTSSIVVRVKNNSNVLTDGGFTIECKGKR